MLLPPLTILFRALFIFCASFNVCSFLGLPWLIIFALIVRSNVVIKVGRQPCVLKHHVTWVVDILLVALATVLYSNVRSTGFKLGSEGTLSLPFAIDLQAVWETVLVVERALKPGVSYKAPIKSRVS